MPLEPTKKVSVDPMVVFEVPERLEFVRKVGSGAYGTVASFKDTKTGQKYAIKKVQDAYNDLVDAKRILREIKVLRHLRHENIICILDLFPPKSPDSEDIYIVTDLMETDLHRVIYSKQELSDEHFQYFVYQMLRGLLYLHSANVLHRDLKPSNILVNKNCDLKICDLGLARGLGDDEDVFTDYVVTRWYRAPEVVLDACHYSKAIDVWAVGCILCELLGRKALFTGRDHLDQIKQIVAVLGTPTEADLDFLPHSDHPAPGQTGAPPSGQGGSAARRFLAKIPHSAGRPFSELYPKANPVALDLVAKMLRFNPLRRITVEDALAHPYFEGLHSAEDEPRCSEAIDWAFDNFTPTKRLLQNLVYEECAKFHPQIVERDAALLKERGIALDPAKFARLARQQEAQLHTQGRS